MFVSDIGEKEAQEAEKSINSLEEVVL